MSRQAWRTPVVEQRRRSVDRERERKIRPREPSRADAAQRCPEHREMRLELAGEALVSVDSRQHANAWPGCEICERQLIHRRTWALLGQQVRVPRTPCG